MPEPPPSCLNCIHCRSDKLDVAEQGLECARCGAFFPVIGGVPVLFEDVVVSRSARPDHQTARQILQAFDLGTDAISMQRVRELFAVTARYGDSVVETEAAQFLDRVRSSGFEVGDAPAVPCAPADRGGGDAPGQAGVRWIRHYIPKVLAPGRELLANVRFENSGSGFMLQHGDGRSAVAARWQEPDGTPVETGDARTPLPIRLAPGQALTLPIRLVTPCRPGRYVLTLLIVEEGRRWLSDQPLAVTVRVGEGRAVALEPEWRISPESCGGYNEDHRCGLERLRRWVSLHAPPHPRILEVGGNAVPMIEGLPGQLFNLDVDLRGLQICHLRQRSAGGSMTEVCADAANLPFPRGCFDAIVMFASLHHFPDPAALLSHLRSRLRPGGFLGLLCEPVGHFWPGSVLPEVLVELDRGVNEQSFTPEEYAAIFRQAGFDPAEAVVDKDSLKARLVPNASA